MERLSINPILNQINLIPRIDTYFVKIYSNPPTFPRGLFLVRSSVKILKEHLLLPFWLLSLSISLF